MRATRNKNNKSFESDKRSVGAVRIGRPAADDKQEQTASLSGPLKKRPLSVSATPKQKETPAKMQSSREIMTLSASRSKRTPKPNPRYNNSDVVTSRKLRKMQDLDAYSSGSDFEDQFDDSDILSEEAPDDDSADYDESDDELPAKKAKVGRKPGGTNKSSVQAKQTPKMKSALREMAQKTMRASFKADRLTDRDIEDTLIRNVKKGPGRPPKASTVLAAEDALHNNSIDRRRMDLEKEKKNAASSLIERNRRLNIELYDSNISTSPAPGPKSSKSLQTARLKMKTALNAGTKSTISKDKLQMSASDGDDDDDMTPANTQDDFETMPTFTIVNVNDIINKKGDVIIGNAKSSDSGLQSKNRRKTGHTTILCDKVDPTQRPSSKQRTPFPPPQSKKPMTILNNNNTAKVSKAGSGDKPAPRILNSTLCKKTNIVTPMISKYANKEPKILNRGVLPKDNLQLNKSISPTTKVVSPMQKRLPGTKETVQQQGTRTIRKITCFETWYVINIPESDVDNSKNKLEIPLIKVGNAAKDIKLPSDKWTFKVTLQAVSESIFSKSSYEEFIGDIQDNSIQSDDRHRYQPNCVMFRRCSAVRDKVRFPYDRAVIFKNKTFFMNIDGRNVKLVGAPISISSLEEIETLLQLVDDLALNSPYVEQTATI